MAMILQRLRRALSPTVIGEIAKTASLEPALTARGMAAAGSVVILALADKAVLPGGPATVFQMLPSHGSSLLGEFAFVARAGVPGTVLIPVLGSGISAVGDTLDRALGFKASSLLPIAVAVVLGLTARIADEQDLDEAGVAELLAAEAKEFRKADGQDVRLVREALDAGRHATLVKARYSPEEWDAVDALTAVREAMETISRMSPSDVPRFRRLVEDVASCVAAVTHPRVGVR